LRIDSQNHGAITVLKPQGPLTQEDASTFGGTLKQAIAEGLGRVVVDISAIPFTDSQGLEVLIEACDRLGRTGMSLKLCGSNETLREVFELTEVADRFEHYADTTSAIRSFL